MVIPEQLPVGVSFGRVDYAAIKFDQNRLVHLQIAITV